MKLHNNCNRTHLYIIPSEMIQRDRIHPNDSPQETIHKPHSRRVAFCLVLSPTPMHIKSELLFQTTHKRDQIKIEF